MWLIVTWWFNYTIIDAFKDGILSEVHNLIKCKKNPKKTTTTKKKNWNQSILLIKNINVHEYLPSRFTYTKRHD